MQPHADSFPLLPDDDSPDIVALTPGRSFFYPRPSLYRSQMVPSINNPTDLLDYLHRNVSVPDGLSPSVPKLGPYLIFARIAAQVALHGLLEDPASTDSLRSYVEASAAVLAIEEYQDLLVRMGARRRLELDPETPVRLPGGPDARSKLLYKARRLYLIQLGLCLRCGDRTGHLAMSGKRHCSDCLRSTRTRVGAKRVGARSADTPAPRDDASSSDVDA